VLRRAVDALAARGALAIDFTRRRRSAAFARRSSRGAIAEHGRAVERQAVSTAWYLREFCGAWEPDGIFRQVHLDGPSKPGWAPAAPLGSGQHYI
jgi:hypothetical protein